MTKSYGESVGINDNPKWFYIPHHPYSILIASDLGAGKTNVLLNVRKHKRPDADKTYLYIKYPF